MAKVLCQAWEESERGWAQRSDGYSLHLTEADLKKYIEEYWAKMPKEVPDEYSRPDGNPYWAEIDSKDKRYLFLKEGHKGYRHFNKNDMPKRENA